LNNYVAGVPAAVVATVACGEIKELRGFIPDTRKPVYCNSFDSYSFL